jgi:uncharacterized protein
MEFAIIAYDGKDEEALNRRLAARESHMKLVESLRAKGHMIHGGAILDDNGKMIGSIIICDFPSREAFDNWFNQDPYVTGNVWQDIQVVPFRTAPPFVDNIPKPVASSTPTS